MPLSKPEMAVQASEPTGSAFPSLEAAHLPQQWAVDSLKKEPISLQFGVLDGTVTHGSAELFGIQDCAIGFNFAPRVIEKPRPHVAGRDQQRRWAQIFEDEVKTGSMIEFNLKVFDGMRG